MSAAGASSPNGGAGAEPALDARLATTLRLRAGHPRATGPLPERVLQFGEGNFLRAFVDWMLERMNRQGLFGGRVVVVQPLATGMAGPLTAQDGRYTVILRGLEDGRATESRDLIEAVSRAIDPYVDFEAFLSCATGTSLRFVVSNTTEAGIRRDPDDRPDARPAPSFPGKLTQLLHARFRAFAGDVSAGLVMLPCELIERNGDALRRCVLETAEAWGLGTAFTRWLDEACVFASTLVDRIVTGYPAAEAATLTRELGYRDGLMVAAESFHSWVIEAPSTLARELPLREAGLNVVFTDDIGPYRERKVRILNGAHTAMVAVGLLDEKTTVKACMDDPLLGGFVERAIYDEILPTLASRLPSAELAAFAASVGARFRNPFIEHRLASIALNSISKYRARILGTLRDHVRAIGTPPPRLTFALAALVALHGRRAGGGGDDVLTDEPAVLEFFRAAWRDVGPRPSPDRCLTLMRRLLSRGDLWGEDLIVALPGLDAAAGGALSDVLELGIRGALARLP